MAWIIFGQKSGKLVLVSDKDEDGSLFSGHYLTVEDKGKKFILRVDDSIEDFPYSPSPLIVDMDLSALSQDQKSINIITLYINADGTNRTIGFCRGCNTDRNSYADC